MTVADLPLDRCLPAKLLELNNDFAESLSYLDIEGAGQLLGQCFMAAHVGDDAFLLALDQDAAYDNPNFRWFKARFDRFVYIDAWW